MNERMAGPIRLRDWGGPGPRVLFTHGMAAHSHWWDSTIERLRGVVHAAALDFRGHGDSEWREDGVYTAQTWVDDIENARWALGWDRFVLCGHSMGARMALEYAEQQAPRLRGVAAVDFLPEINASRASRFTRARGRPQPVYPTQDDAVSRFRLEPGGTVLGPEPLRELGLRSVRPFADGWSWKFDWRCLNHYRMSPVWPQLSVIPVPALLVRGERSEIISPADLERVRADMPKARALEVAGAHHHVPLDRPDEMAQALRTFLAELPA